MKTSYLEIAGDLSSNSARGHSLLTVMCVAMASFILGALIFGMLAKTAWKSEAYGWEEIANRYKKIATSCVFIPVQDGPIPQTVANDIDVSRN